MIKLFERWVIRPYLEWKYKRVSEKAYQEIYNHFTAPNDAGGWPIDFRGMYYDATIEVLGFEPAARMYLEAKKRFPDLTLAFDGKGGWNLVGTVGTMYVYYDIDDYSIRISEESALGPPGETNDIDLVGDKRYLFLGEL